MLKTIRNNSTYANTKLLIDKLDSELKEIYGQVHDIYDAFNTIEFCDKVIIKFPDKILVRSDFFAIDSNNII